MDEDRIIPPEGVFPDFARLRSLEGQFTMSGLEVIEEPVEPENVSNAELAFSIALRDCEDLSRTRTEDTPQVNSFQDARGDMYRAVARYANKLKQHLDDPDNYGEPDPISCLSYFLSITTERATIMLGLCAAIKLSVMGRKEIWFKELTVDYLTSDHSKNEDEPSSTDSPFAKLMRATKPR